MPDWWASNSCISHLVSSHCFMFFCGLLRFLLLINISGSLILRFFSTFQYVENITSTASTKQKTITKKIKIFVPSSGISTTLVISDLMFSPYLLSAILQKNWYKFMIIVVLNSASITKVLNKLSYTFIAKIFQ